MQLLLSGHLTKAAALYDKALDMQAKANMWMEKLPSNVNPEDIAKRLIAMPVDVMCCFAFTIQM